MQYLRIALACLYLMSAAATAEETKYYDYPAAGACVVKDPRYHLSLSIGSNGEIYNNAGEDMEIVCGLSTNPTTSSGFAELRVYVYGRVAATETLVRCKFRAVGIKDGLANVTKERVGGSSAEGLNYRIQLDTVKTRRDVANFSTPVLSCTLAPGASIRAIRLFATE